MGGDWVTSEMAREQVAGYVLHERIGLGADSEVYRAEQVGRPGRVLAIKRIASAVAAADLASLRREAEALRTLAHPGVVRLLEVVPDANGVALVLPYAPGGSLADRLEHGPLAPVEVADLGARLATALAAVHTAGLVHGDVKPGNVLFDREDQPLLADLGASRLRGAGPPHATTEGFVAPEVLDGSPVDAPADVYALGVTLASALGLDAVERQRLASASVLPPDASHGQGVPTTGVPANTDGPVPEASLDGSIDASLDDRLDDPDLEALLTATRRGPDTASWPGVDGHQRLRAAIGAALATDPAHRPRTAADLAGLLDEARRCLEVEHAGLEPTHTGGAVGPGVPGSSAAATTAPDAGAPAARTVDEPRSAPLDPAPTRPFGPKPPAADATDGQDELAALVRWLAVPAMLAVALTPIAFAVWLVLGATQV